MPNLYVASESNELIEVLTSNLQLATEVLEQLQSGTQQLFDALESGELQGKTYQKANQYFLEVLQPLMNSGIQIIEDTKNDLITYQSENNLIAHYGDINREIANQELRLKLEEQSRLEEKLDQIGQLVGFMNAGSIFFSLTQELTKNQLTVNINQLQEEINQLKAKIIAFDEFESHTNQLFADSLSALQDFIQAVNQLNDVHINNNEVFFSDNLLQTINKLQQKTFIAGDTDSNFNPFELPQSYRIKIQKIKSNTKLTPNQKLEQIDELYEDYLYNLAPDAFAKYKKDGKNGELNQALKNFNLKPVLRALGRDAYDVVPDGSNLDKTSNFIGLVNTNQALDLKNRHDSLGNDKLSIWSLNWKDIPADKPDYSGNYLFGYFGQSYFPKPFTNEYLKMGAGTAQAISDVKSGEIGNVAKDIYSLSIINPLGYISSGYLDNPGDGREIQEGISDYEKEEK